MNATYLILSILRIAQLSQFGLDGSRAPYMGGVQEDRMHAACQNLIALVLFA